jgi:IS6 family transposase
MRGLKRRRTARILAAGHTFIRNLRRGHYDLATEEHDRSMLAKAFDDLALAL